MSTDPRVLYGNYGHTGPRRAGNGNGAIRAFGDHKGSGLALMCELLGGALTGNGATSFEERPMSNGMLSFYVDPAKVDPKHFFGPEIDRYTSFVKGARPTAGGEILLPGEPEARMRAERG